MAAGERPVVLASGSWDPASVAVRWLDRPYQPPPELEREADRAIAALAERGSPTHDGLAARLADFRATSERLELELQPARWSLRLVGGDRCRSLTALCVVRTEDGRWLAGRRASWLATWAGRWALGAGGAVEVGENPAETLARELAEEWRLEPRELRVRALLDLPGGMAMIVGSALVAADAEPIPDEEHDAFAWWHPDPDRWPPEADERLRAMARWLA
ncbi:NUDIX hydrolase [Thermoleophilum album]|uniref:ADP-ribose pyrophosphatase YjhB, NUDIX family n=1 Tax=Thermoleophilum album TaxID=29539 RepID=A0A1H6FP48_THEAL|nr:NUDIX domain-containing protein [Thermoleophilum album]SEH11970.1 ADP-ribose pyrophosphatase YjhB, NUDIX family [Thermoleophilum album]